MKIAFLDSGIGGLTVLQSFSSLDFKPNSELVDEIIYLADFANLPYGGRTQDELKTILINNLEFLSPKADLVVLACNTSSAILTQEIRLRFPQTKILRMIDPLQETIRRDCRDIGKIAVFCTEATQKTGVYQKALEEATGEQTEIQVIGCPGLVDSIESEVKNNSSNPKTLELVQEFAKELKFTPELVILGCTHYPLISDTFERVFPRSKLLNPADSVAEELVQNFSISRDTRWIFHSTDKQNHGTRLNNLSAKINCLLNFEENKITI
jgi:glutamate racemase